MKCQPALSRIERPARRLVIGSAVASCVCGLALFMTSPGLPMAWDEGNAIWRAEGIQHWVGRWFSGGDAGRPGPLSRRTIAHDWYYTTRVEGREPEIEGHPAFYGILIALGRSLSERWLPPLQSARVGPMLLFALAAGAMFYRMGREYSTAAATGAVAALVLMPRMFAHAHFASLDGPLTSCWVLAWAAFAPARRGWRGAVLFGAALGLTLSSKATGWIAPVPFVIWTLLYLDRPAAKALAIGLPVALFTFFALNPPLWHDPVGGWISFLAMNLDRSRFNVSTQFFGRMYDLDHPLPWYNTLVWTGVTVPLSTLALMGVGLGAVLRRARRHPAGVLILANAAVLLVIRALPGTPPHDGVRLFLPSFALLAALAGVGCEAVVGLSARRGRIPLSQPEAPERRTAWRRLCDAGRHALKAVVCPRAPAESRHREPAARRPRTSRPSPAARPATRGAGARHLTSNESRMTKQGRRPGTPPIRHPSFVMRHSPLVLLLLLYAASAGSLFWYAPQWLSYYNLAIGGLRGATAAGMEPTYYWDGLDDRVLDWLDRHTGPQEKVRFGAASIENLILMQRWGTLGFQFAADAPGTYRWYVLQHRPSGWQPADRWLVERAEPVLRKTIRAGGWGPWRLDVPLVEVYSYEQYQQACEATRDRELTRSRQNAK